jgi:hypothetical protein
MSKRYLRIHYDEKQRPYITHNNKKIYISNDNKSTIKKYIRKHPNKIKRKKINKNKNKKNVKIMNKLINYVLKNKKKNQRRNKKNKIKQSDNLKESRSIISGSIETANMRKELNNAFEKQLEIERKMKEKQAELDKILKKYNLEYRDNKIKRKRGLPQIRFNDINEKDEDKLRLINNEIEMLNMHKNQIISDAQQYESILSEHHDFGTERKFKTPYMEEHKSYFEYEEEYKDDKKFKMPKNQFIQVKENDFKYGLKKLNKNAEQIREYEIDKQKKILQQKVFDSFINKPVIQFNNLLQKSGFVFQAPAKKTIKETFLNQHYIPKINDEAHEKNIKYNKLINEFSRIYENKEQDFNIPEEQYNDIMQEYENLKIIKQKPKDLFEIDKLIKKQEDNDGEGLNNDDGLTMEQIDYVMTKYKKYLGTYTDSEIDKLIDKIKNNKILRGGAIILIYQHYIALYFDLKNELTIELYDPLGIVTENTQRFKYFVDKLYNKLQKMINNMNIDYLIKFKQNYIQQESQNSSLCGIYCINFLIKRFNNESWKKLTSYKNVSKSEKEMLKKRIQYGFI